MWTVGALANGASATLVLSGSVDAGTGGSVLTNTATITASAQEDLVAGNNSASRAVTVQSADLALAMVVDNATPDEGVTVAFTITLSNSGPHGATGVAVTDLLPSGFTYVSSTPSQGSYSSGTGVWTAGALANGASATLVLRGSVNAGTGGTVLTNTATITAAQQADPVPANNTASRSVTVESANLGVVMVVDNAAPNEGATINFTVTLTNHGPDPASGIAVVDLLPAGLTFVSSTRSQGSYAVGTGRWSVGTLANGGVATMVLRATVNTNTGGSTITNTATITESDHPDPVPGNDAASRAVTVQLAELALAMAVDNAMPNEGEPVAFTITVTNGGPDAATGVAVTDLLPAGLTFAGATPSQGSYASGSGVWTVGGLANGASATLVLQATVDLSPGGPQGSTLTNTATITAAGQADHVPADDTASESVYIPSVGLALTMSVDDATPDVGNTIAFTITLTSYGPDQATNVEVTDLLPAGLVFVSATPSQGTYASGSGVWTVGTVNAGQVRTLVLRGSVAAGTGGTTITNTATITGVDQADPIPSTNQASRSVTVTSADLALAMSVSNAAPNEGGTITFTITLGNNGPDDASGVAVTDLLPAGLTFVGASASQGSFASGTGVWTVGTLPEGETETLTLTASVDAATGGTTIVNTASVTAATQEDPVAGNNSASRSVTVRLADLGLAMTVSNAAPNEGELIIFTITIANGGPNSASGVVVSDLLPASLVFSSGTITQGSYSVGTGVWSVGTLANGATATLTLRVRPATGTGGTTIVNTATITAATQADHNVANNSASRSVTVELADLAVALSVDDATPDEGGTVVFTVTLTNHGPGNASGVTVRNLLPAGLAFAGATASLGSYASGSGDWSVGSLANGAVATLALTGTVQALTGGSTIIDSVRVTASDQADHTAANDAAGVSLRVQLADLALALSVNDPTPNEGSAVTFTLTLTNLGPDAASGIVVRDLLPVGLTYTGSTASQGSYSSGSGLWTVGGLANGASATLALDATVSFGTGGNTIIDSARVVATDQADHTAANNVATAGVGVTSADLGVAMAVDLPVANEGDLVTYTVTVTNDGPDPATGVAVTDALPAGLTFSGATPSQGAYTSGTGLWAVESLASGASATLVLAATVDAGTGGASVVNSAVVTASDQADPVGSNNNASRSVAVPLADLGVAVTVDDATPNEGQTVTFTITLTNYGPDAASGIAVTGGVTAGLAYQGSTPSQGTYSEGSRTWTVGGLGSGASATLQIEALVNPGTAGTTLSDTARIAAADQADHASANDAAGANVRVQLADLGLALSASDAAPNEGDTLTLTLTLANGGPDSASGITVTRPLPAGLAVLNVNASHGGWASGSGEWTVGSLANGESATLALDVTVGAGTGGTAIADSARITAVDQADPVASNDAAGAVLSIPSADLAVALAASNPTPIEGEAVTFTITLENLGPDAASGVDVTSVLPAGLTYSSAVPSQGAYSSASGVWSVGGLAAGATATLALDATVDAGLGGATLVVGASVTASDQADPAAANDSAGVSLGVPSADLGVAIAASTHAPIEGGTVTLTITLANQGPDDANGIAVTNALPAGLALLGSTPSQGSFASGSGVWTVGTVAHGGVATLALEARVQSGTGGTILVDSARVSASDRPDPVSANDRAGVALAIPLATLLTATDHADAVLLVGDASREVWRMKLRNPSAVAETLTAFAITNGASGPGSVAQLDASWTPLALTLIHGGASLAGGSASFAAGKATFAGLSAAIPAGDSLELVLSGGASSLARVGDTLDLRLAAASDLTFSTPVMVNATWPVDPAGAFAVDGMLASQVLVEPRGPGNLNAGLTRQLALEVLLPSNGYAADQLQRLGVVNLGTAASGTDITRVEAWADDGDGAFSAANDRRLGPLIFTGARWEITGLAETVPVGGLRVFWTVDLAQFATQGLSVRLAIPPAPDVGAGMASGNSGPLDVHVEEPLGFTISSLDRVTLSAVPLPSGIARPGERGLALLHLVATNSYASDRTLSDLSLANATTGTGTVAQRDAEIQVLTLREDGNGDGVLSGTGVDPVLGTAFFSGGAASFSGLRWTVPSGQSRHLFVTADVSLGDAADGDVLAAVVPGELAAAFLEPTALNGGWPLDSGCRFTIDGFTSAQLATFRTPSATIGPNDAGVVALDFVVPRDGYRDDVLRSVRVVNLGNATAADIAMMNLWRDGGDGLFSGGGDDVLISPLVPQSGGWQSPVVAVPIGAAGLHCFVSIDVAGAPAESVTVRLSIPVDGVDNASGNDGPADAAVINPDGLLISGAPLLASLVVPPAATQGQDVAVRMSVRNTSNETVNAIAPSSLAITGTGTLALASGPTPASIALAPGAIDTFTWHYTATGVGDARFTGNAAGTGATSGLYRRAPFATSGMQQIFVGTNLLAMIPVHTMPVNVNRGQAGIVPFSLTLTNQGGPGASDARLTHLRIRLEDPAATGIVPSDLVTRVEVNEGTNVYLVKTAIETSGSEVDLVLDSPVFVDPAQPTTLTLRLDLSAGTQVPAFRICVPDSSWFEADDATSGAPVTVAVVPGGYPLHSEIARVVAEADRVTVERIAAVASRVSRGSVAVPLLELRIDNPGVTGISSDVRVHSLALGLIDSLLAAVPEPAARVKQLRVRTGAQVVATQLVLPGGGELLTIPFSPPLTVPANTPLDVTIEADISDTAHYGRFAARLAADTTFEARDATTRNRVAVEYATTPIDGGGVTVEAAAESLVAGGTPLFPSTVLIGTASVPALAVTFRNPGAPGTSRVRFDSLRVDCRDEARRPFVPSAFFTAFQVSWNGTVVATASNLSVLGSVTVPLPALLLEPGDSATVQVAVDVSPAAPAQSIELMLGEGGIMAFDSNTDQPVRSGAAPGHDLPVLSGLARLQLPARFLSVGMTSRMPVTLSADGGAVDAAVLALTNADAAGAGAIRVDRLTLRAADRDFAGLPVGAAAGAIEAWVDGSLWAESGPLTPASATALLVAATPLSIAPGDTTQVEIRMVTSTRAASPGFRLGVDQADIGVIQPASASLAVTVQPAPGRTFPMWSDAAGLTATTLAESYANFPNPFAAGREATTFVYYLRAPARVSIRIYTPHGEPVATLLEAQARASGLHQDDRWDGRNGRGQSVYNGVYVARLEVRYDDGTSDQLMRKLAVVR